MGGLTRLARGGVPRRRGDGLALLSHQIAARYRRMQVKSTNLRGNGDPGAD